MTNLRFHFNNQKIINSVPDNFFIRGFREPATFFAFFTHETSQVSGNVLRKVVIDNMKIRIFSRAIKD